MADTKYSDVFAELADDEALKRFENNLPLQRRFLSLSDEDRQKAKLSIYEVLSEDPDFMKRVSEEEEKRKPYLSKVIDDLGNIPQAWRAGNFYSYGGWSDLASTLIDDINPLQSGEGAKSSAARREELYQNYRKWREENPAPENKTLLGDVATGAAGLVPLFVDMNIEAATPTLAAAGIGAGVGSVAGGAGAVPAGVAAGLLGYKASMITQSGKVALADIYTSLRDEGFDDATSATWAYRLAVPYGALEYAGRALAPVSRLALGSGGLRGVIDKIADKGVKNKILNYAAKAGMDIAATGTAESAIEGAQAVVVEGARQGAGGEGFDAGKMAQAATEEFKGAAPAMYGMALLGIVPQAGARRAIERVKTGGDKRNAPAAPENAAEPFGGSAAEAGQQAEGAGGAGVWGSPEGGGQGGLQFGETEAGGGTRQGGLQFGEAGGSPRADYFIYGADGNLVGTSREPAILPTSGGIYYDSYASAFADAGRRGGRQRSLTGGKSMRYCLWNLTGASFTMPPNTTRRRGAEMWSCSKTRRRAREALLAPSGWARRCRLSSKSEGKIRTRGPARTPRSRLPARTEWRTCRLTSRGKGLGAEATRLFPPLKLWKIPRKIRGERSGMRNWTTSLKTE